MIGITYDCQVVIGITYYCLVLLIIVIISDFSPDNYLYENTFENRPDSGQEAFANLKNDADDDPDINNLEEESGAQPMLNMI